MTIRILDELRFEDEEILNAMDAYQPKTRFKPGDLARLVDIPMYLQLKRRPLPQYWQIRFIISTWMYEILGIMQSEYVTGLDHAMSLLERRRGLHPNQYTRPVIYAHGFPHGANPDSATWFSERSLKKVGIRSTTADWEVVLDEAKAPFMGYDTDHLQVPYTFDVAPDLYANGENIGNPFSFEEGAFHTASLLGLEPAMMTPITYTDRRPRLQDED